MQKILAYSLIIVIFGILFAGTVWFWQGQLAVPSENLVAAVTPIQQQNPEISEEIHTTSTLLFVGDVMLNRYVESKIKQHNNDWRWPFLNIADTLNAADLVFGNLESQISDKGHNVGSIYSFRADPKAIESLQYAGFDAVSVANNHSFDYTKEAYEDSRARLLKAGIAPVADTLIIKEVSGTKIGFLAYSNYTGPAFATLDNLPEIALVIAHAKTKVDILAVSLHAGEEYQPQPNEFQKKFAKGAIDAGADLIIGHHPHVLQPLEKYKNGWIIYSLGNFMFDQDFSEETMQGAILQVILQDKKIKEVSLLPTRITPALQVELVE